MSCFSPLQVIQLRQGLNTAAQGRVRGHILDDSCADPGIVDLRSASLASALSAIEPIDQSAKSLFAPPTDALCRARRQASPNRLRDADRTGARELQALIRRMARENPSWGEERIANELLLKLGIRLSPRTVNEYLPGRPRGQPRDVLRWSVFLRLQAQGIIACDFFVAVTATFRLLYVFVVIEHRSRRLIHCKVTAHPSAAWTLQQLREVVGYEDQYKFLIQDRDCIFASHLDESIQALGIKVWCLPALNRIIAEHNCVEALRSASPSDLFVVDFVA